MKNKQGLYSIIAVIIALAIGVGAAFAHGAFRPSPKEEKKVEVVEPSPVEEEEEVNEEPAEDVEEEDDIDEPLVVDESEGRLTDNTTYEISGKITNVSKKDFGLTTLTCVLYDEDGNQVGTTTAHTNELKAGETWSFHAVCFGQDMVKVKSFKITELQGF